MTEYWTIKRVLTSHNSTVYALAILLNGDLVSGSADWTIKIWNPNDGTLKRTLNGHTDYVEKLTTLLNGDLVSGSDDTTIRIWNPHDGTLNRTLNGGSFITALTTLTWWFS